MKKLYSSIVALMLTISLSIAQPINDQVVIPMGITINSITRMQVVSGGNIEFVFSSLDDFSTGILYTRGYSTVISLASSEAITVNLKADQAAFNGDATAGTLALDKVQLQTLAANVTGVNITSAFASAILTAADQAIATTAAAAVANGTFQIDWQCGVTNTCAGVAPDRYAANIIITAQ